MKYIRIISAPAGNAPLLIRNRWIGLKLPVSPRPDREHVRSTKMASEYVGSGGYVVEAADALSVLHRSSPTCANWWRRNLPPSAGNQFVFASTICKPIDH